MPFVTCAKSEINNVIGGRYNREIGQTKWYLYRIINKQIAPIQPLMPSWWGSTILKPCIISVTFPKTFRKTTALVTFRGDCAKNLSQSVTL